MNKINNKEMKPIKASVLIAKIKKERIEADVFDDEDCYPQLFRATIEADQDGTCSVNAYYGYREDSPRYGVTLGKHKFEVEGVEFSAERNCDGDHDPLVITGRKIDYDKGLTEDDVIDAAEENVEFCEYDSDNYEFDSSDVTTDDVIDALDECPEYFVETEDGEVLGFDDEDDIPEGCTKLDHDEAVRRIVEEADINYDFWG